MFWVVTGSGQVSWWRVAHTGGGAPDPVLFSQRASAVGAGVRVAGGASIVLVRGESGPPEVYLGAQRSKSATMLAGSLASAVGARTQPLDGAPELDVSVPIWRLRADPSEYNGRDTQAGRSPVEVAEFIARSMPKQSWLILAMRGPSRLKGWDEQAAARRWWAHRLAGAATHYSRATESVLGRIVAGGEDPGEVRDFLAAIGSALPGFDVEVRAWRAWERSWLIGLGVLLAVVPAVLVGTPLVLTGEALSVVSAWFAGHGLVGAAVLAAVAAPGLLLAFLGWAGFVPSAADLIRRRLSSGGLLRILTYPPFLVRKPTSKGSGKDSDQVSTMVLKAGKDAGSYPLFRRTFLLGPEQVSALACPHYGSSSVAELQVRQVPMTLREWIGPLVGRADAPDGQSVGVHLSAADQWSSVFISGIAGSGKSNTVQNLFAFDLLEQTQPSGLPGFPGARNAIVAFESKGAEGAEGYLRWAHAIQAPMLVVDVADPESLAIDMLMGESPADRAANFTAAMKYAFGENAIQYRSENTLRQVFEFAQAVVPADLDRAGLPSGLSFVEVANVLLGGEGDSTGALLHAAVMERLHGMRGDDPAREGLERALRQMEPLYGVKVTPSARRTLCEAPQSKVAVLASVPSWWRSSERSRVGFETILVNHWAVLINTGRPLSGGQLAYETLTENLSGMLMWFLQRAIMQTCDGWRAQGRSVTLFSDELSLLAGKSGEVLQWLRNQGRSVGVREVLATQFPEQLADDVRRTVMGSGTTIWFQQKAPDVVDRVVADLVKDGSSWSSADLVGLPPFTAIVKATVDQKQQPAVLVRMGFWADGPESMDRFIVEQGYRVPVRPQV